VKDPIRVKRLQSKGATIYPVASLADGRLDLTRVVRILHKEEQIERIMIEGGASILSSFLKAGLADCVVITVSPQFVASGVSMSVDHVLKSPVVTERLGKDIIVTCNPF
jgi:2,5-diamino-6-(ribosylamino)-4(3H)-pyrimidinone 5'-phosphate reductase